VRVVETWLQAKHTAAVGAVFIPPFRLTFRHLGFIWHLDFVIWTWFIIRALAFELYLAFASLRHSADLHGPQT
jgi:hypothetical protein